MSACAVIVRSFVVFTVVVIAAWQPSQALADPGETSGVSTDTIIVFDASRSMYGRIGGRTKIEIARETLSSVLGEAAPDMNLGMIAYGHRERGSCEDIENVLAPGPARETVPRLLDFARHVTPRGKTPLSESVRRAAEQLNYTENAAKVVLITDGVETCNADPCALGQELEAAGVDFTAHVVGVGMSADEGRQVACLAENTGGRYFTADSGAALADALRQAVVISDLKSAPPQVTGLRPVHFTWRDTEGGPFLNVRAFKMDLRPLDGAADPQNIRIWHHERPYSAEALFEPGHYVALIERVMPGKKSIRARIDFEVPEGSGAFVVDRVIAARLRLDGVLTESGDIQTKPLASAHGGSQPRLDFEVVPISNGTPYFDEAIRLVHSQEIPLPSGQYLVRGFSPDFAREKLVTVEPGQTKIMRYNFDVAEVFVDLALPDGSPRKRPMNLIYETMEGENWPQLKHVAWGRGTEKGKPVPFLLPPGLWRIKAYDESDVTVSAEAIIEISRTDHPINVRLQSGDTPNEILLQRFNDEGRIGCLNRFARCLIEAVTPEQIDRFTSVDPRGVEQAKALSNFDGTWSTSEGQLQLVRDGRKVIGAWYSGSIPHSIEGQLSSDLKTMRGAWIAANGKSHGLFEIKLSDDGRRFIGNWHRGDRLPKGDEWAGRRLAFGADLPGSVVTDGSNYPEALENSAAATNFIAEIEHGPEVEQREPNPADRPHAAPQASTADHDRATSNFAENQSAAGDLPDNRPFQASPKLDIVGTWKLERGAFKLEVDVSEQDTSAVTIGGHPPYPIKVRIASAPGDGCPKVPALQALCKNARDNGGYEGSGAISAGAVVPSNSGRYLTGDLIGPVMLPIQMSVDLKGAWLSVNKGEFWGEPPASRQDWYNLRLEEHSGHLRDTGGAAPREGGVASGNQVAAGPSEFPGTHVWAVIDNERNIANVTGNMRRQLCRTMPRVGYGDGRLVSRVVNPAWSNVMPGSPVGTREVRRCVSDGDLQTCEIFPWNPMSSAPLEQPVNVVKFRFESHESGGVRACPVDAKHLVGGKQCGLYLPCDLADVDGEIGGRKLLDEITAPVPGFPDHPMHGSAGEDASGSSPLSGMAEASSSTWHCALVYGRLSALNRGDPNVAQAAFKALERAQLIEDVQSWGQDAPRDQASCDRVGSALSDAGIAPFSQPSGRWISTCEDYYAISDNLKHYVSSDESKTIFSVLRTELAAEPTDAQCVAFAERLRGSGVSIFDRNWRPDGAWREGAADTDTDGARDSAPGNHVADANVNEVTGVWRATRKDDGRLYATITLARDARNPNSQGMGSIELGPGMCATDAADCPFAGVTRPLLSAGLIEPGPGFALKWKESDGDALVSQLVMTPRSLGGGPFANYAFKGYMPEELRGVMSGVPGAGPALEGTYGKAIFLDLRRVGELPDDFEPEAKAELRIRTRLKLADGSVLAEPGAPVGWSLAEVTPGGWQSDLPRVGPSAEIVRESHSLDFGSEYFVLANIGHAKIQSAPFTLDDASDEVELTLDRPLLVLKFDSLEGGATVRLSTDAPALPSPFGEDKESVSLTKLKEAKQVATLARPGSLHIVVEADGNSFTTTYEVSAQPLQIIDLGADTSDTGSPKALRQEVMVHLKPRMMPEDMLGRTYLLPASGADADEQLQSGTLIPSGDYIAVFEPNVGAPVTVPASVGGHGNEQEIVWDAAFAMVEVSFVDRASGRPFAPPGGWQVATFNGSDTVETFDQFMRGNRNGNKTFSLVPDQGRTYEVRALDSDGTVLGTADVSGVRIGEQAKIEINASPDVAWKAVRLRAEAVLQRLYKEHLARLAKADTDIQVLAHEGLASDLGFHQSLASLVTSGELGFDPIIDAQDHDIGEVAVETDEDPDPAGRVVATARFTNFGKVQTVRYYLQSGGWEGAEIVDVEGDGWRLSEAAAPRR